MNDFLPDIPLLPLFKLPSISPLPLHRPSSSTTTPTPHTPLSLPTTTSINNNNKNHIMIPTTPFFKKYGPWALITGASSGIGAAFAKHLAATHNLNLILVARRRPLIDTLAAELQDSHHVQVHCVTADLTQPAGIDATVAACKGRDVGLVVNNAGMEVHGSFLRHAVEDHARMVALNVTAPMSISHAVLPALLRRVKASQDGKRAGIIFTSSIARNPMPYLATYSASKAFASNLAIVLRAEFTERYGVDVLSLEPGAIDTEMLKGEDGMGKVGWETVSAGECVREAVEGLEGGRVRVTPGVVGDVEGERGLMKGLEETGRMMEEALGEGVCGVPSEIFSEGS